MTNARGKGFIELEGRRVVFVGGNLNFVYVLSVFSVFVVNQSFSCREISVYITNTRAK